jgi:hypothetical protein
MALGMDNLLRSMGFDVDELQAQFTRAKDTLAATVKHFDARMDAIETLGKATDAKLDELLALSRENERVTAWRPNDEAPPKEEVTNGKRLKRSASGAQY